MFKDFFFCSCNLIVLLEILYFINIVLGKQNSYSFPLSDTP